MLYEYQALNQKGDTVTDYIDAPTETAARQKIRSQGLYPVKISRQEVSDATKKKGAPSSKPSPFKKYLDGIQNFISVRTSKKQIGLFSRQLATLLTAGVPLPTAISNTVEEIEHKHFKNIVADIKDKIEEGSSFSNALQVHKNIFSNMFINMVRVGENLGSLDAVVERLADLEMKKSQLGSKIKAALWYPLFMFSFAVLVVIFLMINVIPRIAAMFVEQKKDLPLPTEIVIAVSGFLQNFWFLIPILIVVLAYVYKRYVSNYEGRKRVDEFKLNLPLFKSLYKKNIVMKFTQNLGILLNNNVDIIKSFEIVEKIVGNSVIQEKIAEAGAMVKEGSSVHFALRKTEFLPKMVLGMIQVGEQSDKLDEMLLKIGQVYETELDNTITGLTSLIEPVIIIFMGVIIGLIVISVMLPIMEMNFMVFNIIKSLPFV